jgi:hypothetical protein
MSDADRRRHRSVRTGPVRASLAFVACLLRSVPLFFGAAPKTPLRVLAIVAVDTLHLLRQSQCLPRKRIHELAWLIDFQGCANAAWDHKTLSQADYEAVQQRLVDAGWGACIDEYLRQLRELESRRPAIGEDRFDDVRSYREEVARLAVSTVAAIALNAECGAEDIRARRCDDDVELLFRILMQCQIIDDVIDYPLDASGGLPSFLTVSASLPRALAFTEAAARLYAARPEKSSRPAVFPVRATLSAVSVVTKLFVRLARLRLRSLQSHVVLTCAENSRGRTSVIPQE